MAKRDEDGLLPVQRRFIRAFIHDEGTRGNISAAAKKVNRSPKRFYDWLGEPAFKGVLEREIDRFLYAYGPAVGDATVKAAMDPASPAAAKRLFWELIRKLKGAGEVTVNTMNVKVVTREDAMRVIQATIRALKLHGDKALAGLLAEEHDVIEAEFKVLATG